MIKITYAKLVQNDSLQSAIMQLDEQRLPDKLSYEAGKFLEAVDKVRVQIETEYKKELLNGFAKKDAKGKIEVDPADANRFVMDESKREEFEKIADAFWAREAHILHRGLSAETIQRLQFRPKERIAIEVMVRKLEDASHQHIAEVIGKIAAEKPTPPSAS